MEGKPACDYAKDLICEHSATARAEVESEDGMNSAGVIAAYGKAKRWLVMTVDARDLKALRCHSDFRQSAMENKELYCILRSDRHPHIAR